MGNVYTCRCANREARLFFHFSEARFPKTSIAEGAEVTLYFQGNRVHESLIDHTSAMPSSTLFV